jgi:hypothetical protein
MAALLATPPPPGWRPLGPGGPQLLVDGPREVALLELFAGPRSGFGLAGRPIETLARQLLEQRSLFPVDGGEDPTEFDGRVDRGRAA